MPGIVKLFVDESGDLGFKKSSTKTFVVGYLIADNPLRLSCDLKKLRSRLFKKYGINIGEFKFHEDTDRVRFKVLDLIAKSEVRCGFVAINKMAVKEELKQKPDRLYNYLVVNYPIKNVIHKLRPDKIEYVIDKQVWSRERRDSFNMYIMDKASWVSVMECSSPPPRIIPKHESSHNNPCLQIADYIAGSVFRLSERGKGTYLDKIRTKLEWKDTWGLLIE